MQPSAVLVRNDALGSQDDTILLTLLIGQLIKNPLNLLFRILLRRLLAPAGKYLVGVMMALMAVMMVVVAFMIVIVVAVLMLFMVVIVVAVLMLFVVVIVVAVLMLLMVMIVVAVLMFFMVMMTMLAFVVMVTTFRADLRLPQQLLCKIILSFHHFKNLLSRDVFPRRGDDRRLVIERTNQLDGLLQLVLLHILGTA